ncbi:unnamed protein product [Pedinophyceae sp. YPF-701]|nr:unnamed protein product [Pedinophyceae sp. YPF-701]
MADSLAEAHRRLAGRVSLPTIGVRAGSGPVQAPGFPASPDLQHGMPPRPPTVFGDDGDMQTLRARAVSSAAIHDAAGAMVGGRGQGGACNGRGPSQGAWAGRTHYAQPSDDEILAYVAHSALGKRREYDITEFGQGSALVVPRANAGATVPGRTGTASSRGCNEREWDGPTLELAPNAGAPLGIARSPVGRADLRLSGETSDHLAGRETAVLDDENASCLACDGGDPTRMLPPPPDGSARAVQMEQGRAAWRRESAPEQVHAQSPQQHSMDVDVVHKCATRRWAPAEVSHECYQATMAEQAAPQEAVCPPGAAQQQLAVAHSVPEAQGRSASNEELMNKLFQKVELLMANTETPPRDPHHRVPRHSSKYRGVTKHRRTGRYEGHVWHEGKQLYLGGYHQEVHAARAHDVMALQCRGPKAATLNFAMEHYAQVLPFVRLMGEEDVMQTLRRLSRSIAGGM